MINKKELNTVPWCNPTWRRKLSLKVPLTLTRLQPFLYIDCIFLTNNSSIPSLPKAHRTLSLGIPSKAFSKSINTTYKFFIAKYFSCNCFNIKMTFVVPHLGIKPNCFLSMSICCHINFSIINLLSHRQNLSARFPLCWNNSFYCNLILHLMALHCFHSSSYWLTLWSCFFSIEQGKSLSETNYSYYMKNLFSRACHR